MPAPGEQHQDNGGRITANPFEEVKPRVSEYTAHEISILQSRLQKRLGPEYLSSRPGPAGQKIHYLAGDKCIQLANEVFGFNGWSSSIVSIQVDFVDENPKTLKFSLGLSVIVRITLRDGTYHEDIGYGDVENCKGKAAAFHKAKKEGTTDGLKRALRNFGNVLGNCLYDKDYLTKVLKMKVTPSKWDANDLHRHSSYVLAKAEVGSSVTEDVKQNESADLTSSEILDDEFGDFDEADFGVGHDPDSYPDEMILPASVAPHHSVPDSFKMDPGAGLGLNQADHNSHVKPSNNLIQAVPAAVKPDSGIRAPENGNTRNAHQPQQQYYPPPVSNAASLRSTSGNSTGGQMRPPQEASATARAPQGVPLGSGRTLNQPSRTGITSAPQSPAQQLKVPGSKVEEIPESNGVAQAHATGFFSARAATMLPEVRDTDGPPPLLPGNLPTFNPHAESPSIRKTPGIDHNKSLPLSKELRHVPSAAQATESAPPGQMRSNFMNPLLDAARRIGAPGSPSPMANRGSYKPPTIKRSLQGQNMVRPPLGDIPSNGTAPGPEGGGDVKRIRLSGS